MLTVKNNQPLLFDSIERAFESKKSEKVIVTHDRGHGRDEVRKVEIISVDPSSSSPSEKPFWQPVNAVSFFERSNLGQDVDPIVPKFRKNMC